MFVIRITATRIGAMYLIITTQAFSALNSLEISISSTSVLGLMIQPTNTHVRIATMGMSTEFDMKSKKSSNVEPSPMGWMNESEL